MDDVSDSFSVNNQSAAKICGLEKRSGESFECFSSSKRHDGAVSDILRSRRHMRHAV